MGRIILSYLKKTWRTAAVVVLTAAVFAMVFYLYNLPMETFIYGSMLTGAAWIFFALVGLVRYWRRYNKLESVRNHILVTSQELPVAGDDTEAMYQEMLGYLRREYHKKDREDEEKYQEMLEYYTLWAHQIKTPIAAMGLLLQEEDTSLSRQMSMELFKTEQYVEMALGYLRSDSMSGDLVIEEISLDKVLRQVIRKYAKVFILKKIALEYEGVDCTVLTDEKWLVFVLEQIISNALKYTREGKVALYMADDEEQTLVIEDTGIGVRAEDLPRIFEKGFTGYNGRQDKRSTGIGLYLSGKILKKLHHEIRVESKVDEGTRVYIALAKKRLEVFE